MNGPNSPPSPSQVLLFSGHMIDGEDRAQGLPGRKPRFPPDCEPAVAQHIAAKLTDLHVGPDDLGLTQGACGGDLLFAEALLERGACLELHLPFEEARFIAESVDFAKAPSSIADRWRERFLAVRNHPRVQVRVLSTTASHGDTVFERCNLWMLERATSFGAGKLRFICLWNGEGGDGPGGTQHMRSAVQQRGGEEHWIDIENVCRPSGAMRP